MSPPPSTRGSYRILLSGGNRQSAVLSSWDVRCPASAPLASRSGHSPEFSPSSERRVALFLEIIVARSPTVPLVFLSAAPNDRTQIKTAIKQFSAKLKTLMIREKHAIQSAPLQSSVDRHIVERVPVGIAACRDCVVL